jgi:hypothetical protein
MDDDSEVNAHAQSVCRRGDASHVYAVSELMTDADIHLPGTLSEDDSEI